MTWGQISIFFSGLDRNRDLTPVSLGSPLYDGCGSRSRGRGSGASLLYAAAIAWLSSASRRRSPVTGGFARWSAPTNRPAGVRRRAAVLQREQYVEARAAFARADTAERDARTQFYIAYSYYREGWGRLYNDDALFAKGIAAADKAIALAPNGRLVVDDIELQMRSADELRAELQRGITREASDFNPLKVFRSRK